jgi:pimeloyl-ACP methyl ester carboxylesterase
MPLHHSTLAHNSTNGRANIAQRLLSTLSRTAPWLAVRVAERLFVTSFRASQPARELEWVKGSETFTVFSPYGPLAAWQWGRGARTVLLMHGWGGRGLQMGAFVVPLVEQGFRVVAFDAPGHGRSPGKTCNLLILTETVKTVARTLGPLTGVVAHSIGGTATMLALGRGELAAERAVVLAPATYMSTVIQQFGVSTGFTPQVLKRVRDRFETRLRFSWSQLEPLRFADSLDLPLLIVHDRYDREMPWSDSSDLAGRLCQAQLTLTSGLGHRRLLRDPQVVSRAVGFLCGHNATDDAGVVGAIEGNAAYL